LDEIATNDGSNIAVYEFNGENSDSAATLQDNVFLVKADVDGDGIDEIIEGSQDANEVSIDGVFFSVFEFATQTRRGERKSNKGKGNSKVTICHKGKQTKEIPESALGGHLGHGDTMGACPPPKPIPEPTPTPEPTPQPTPTPEPTPQPTPTPEPTPQPTPDPKPGIIYGVNIAAGDLTGNGTADIVAAMAQNGSKVAIHAGDGTLINSFAAFDTNNGVLVAVGDVNGQTSIIAAEPNGTEIRIFDASGTQIGSFPVDGNIISLAVGMSAIEEVVTPPITTPDGSTPTVPQQPGDPTTEPTGPDDSTSDTTEPQPEDLQPKIPGDVSDETQSPADKYEIIEPTPPNVPALPTSGDITVSNNYNGETLTDINVKEGVSVANATLVGDTTNAGLLSNVTVPEDATLQGGTVSGNLNNEGTVTDITFVGDKIVGGELGGTITIASDTELGLGTVQDVTVLPEAIVTGGMMDGEITNFGLLLDIEVKVSGIVIGGMLGGNIWNEGILQDVTLIEDTWIMGGFLTGEVFGDIKEPALIEEANFNSEAKLANVIIGQDCEIEEGVEIGTGVRFTDNDSIPEETDLSAALTTDGEIDFSTDVVTDAPSLLTQINALPDMQDNDWQLEQNDDRLEVMVDGTRMRVKPKRVKQAKRNRRAEIIIHGDGTVTVITAKGREILVEVQVVE